MLMSRDQENFPNSPSNVIYSTQTKTQQEVEFAPATTATHGFVSQCKQILKGITALFGLVTLGGVGYWLTSYWRGNSGNNTTESLSSSGKTVPTLNNDLELTSNDAGPVIEHNYLSVGQGQAVILDLDMLSATDSSGDATSLTFDAYDIQHGRFDFVFNQGIELFQFTQIQVANNLVRFVHDNSLFAPSYAISVSDATSSSSQENATVIFDLAPVLQSNFLFIGQGQEVVLTSNMLNATDPDTNTTALNFISSEIQHGQFIVISSGLVTSQFSQAQLRNKEIKFLHDGTVVAPAYKISVSDTIVTVGPYDAAITFYKAPQLLTHGLTVYQGQTVPVNNAVLYALTTHADTLMFKISNLVHGKFSLMSMSNSAISSFTQQQVLEQQVQFTHDNSQRPNMESERSEQFGSPR